MQEEEKEELLKTEKQQKKMKKKDLKADASNVVKTMEIPEISYLDGDMGDSVEEVEVGLIKHDKKKNKKKRESDREDSNITNGQSSIGQESKKSTNGDKNQEEAELEVRKDENIEEKKKKKKKKKGNDKEVTGFSSPEIFLGSLDGMQDINKREEDIGKDEGHKREKSSNDSNVNGQKKRKKDRGKLNAGSNDSNVESSETNVPAILFDVKEKRTGNIKQLELEKDSTHNGRRETVEDVKERKKEKDQSESSLTKVPSGKAVGRKIITEDKKTTDYGGFKDSSNNKKGKRKMEDDSVESGKDENNSRKKVKKTVSTEDKRTTKDCVDGVSKTISDEKNKWKKKKDVASLEGISNKNVNDGDKTTARSRSVAKDKVDEGTSSVRKEECTDRSKIPQSSKKSRRVSFSGEVEVFPPTEDTDREEYDEKDLVRGKRFSKEEDELVKEAVFKYVQKYQLGEEGVEMVINCRSYPQVKSPWREIGSALPWRPYLAVYYRAQILFKRSEERKWEPEEYEILRRFHEKHGADWTTLANILGKHRFHVKDCWRRIKLSTFKNGPWSQEEYQTLFDLVNMDLRMKAFEEKKTKHGMLKDNISWEAISQKLSTRFNGACCIKWYTQLSSPLVAQGLWSDTDDFRLVDELLNSDACCVEDVDWDNLLEHRSGEVCQKRWNQMTRHIGGNREKPFIEQVEVLSKRYCLDMLEYRS